MIHDVPGSRNAREGAGRRVNVFVQDPERTRAGSCVLPNQIGLSVTIKVSYSSNVVYDGNRAQTDPMIEHAVVEDPNIPTTADRILPDQVRLAVTQKVADSRNMPTGINGRKSQP